ncbi:MAG: HD domain-containing protein [Actinobacteria bacterium]|uniref:Unannotated protein n=1 Tax=freshwater metagenome TaxID=449393 RepID=A0A6J5ZTU1_9ZZZZ|nr:HD domain-containing protein [Actinomycetota bacterium]
MTEQQAIEMVRDALAGDEVWLVGGVVRDRILGRSPGGRVDIDLVTAGDAGQAARKIAERVDRGVAVFPLSDEFGSWRVSGADGSWQVDCTPIQGGSLEQDLLARDLTVNAIAERLDGGSLIDPSGGVSDLERRTLRMPGPNVFEADPLRAVRLARFTVQLGFEPDASAVAAARKAAAGLDLVAGERIYSEFNAILASADPVGGIRMLDDCGVSGVILPELQLLKGIDQTAYHHLDAYEHTLEVLQNSADMQSDAAAYVGSALGPRVAQVLNEELADEMTRATALRWGALLHDIAKPQTRTEFSDGRIGFPEHAAQGAVQARTILERFRASEKVRAHVAKLTKEHLRLGFLVHERPLGRSHLYRYMIDCRPVEVDVTLLSLADRHATRGRKSEEAIALHGEIGEQVLVAALDWRSGGPPEPLYRGDLLARDLGIATGPKIGELLDAIQEAQYCGEVTTRPQALELAEGLLGGL